jgi:hypothetical protein
MSAVSVRIEDNGTFAALTAMQNIAPLTNGLVQGAEYLREQLARYATQFSHPMVPPLTPKARRYLMWAIKNGVIKVPYVRSQTLASSWTVQAQGLSATVGTSVGYAPLVKSERMTMYHRITGHESATFTAQQATPKIVDLFSAGVAVWVG